MLPRLPARQREGVDLALARGPRRARPDAVRLAAAGRPGQIRRSRRRRAHERRSDDPADQDRRASWNATGRPGGVLSFDIEPAGRDIRKLSLGFRAVDDISLMRKVTAVSRERAAAALDARWLVLMRCVRRAAGVRLRVQPAGLRRATPRLPALVPRLESRSCWPTASPGRTSRPRWFRASPKIRCRTAGQHPRRHGGRPRCHTSSCRCWRRGQFRACSGEASTGRGLPLRRGRP